MAVQIKEEMKKMKKVKKMKKGFLLAGLVKSNDQLNIDPKINIHVWVLFKNKRQAKRVGAWSVRKVTSVNSGPGRFRSWSDGVTILDIAES